MPLSQEEMRRLALQDAEDLSIEELEFNVQWFENYRKKQQEQQENKNNDHA